MSSTMRNLLVSLTEACEQSKDAGYQHLGIGIQIAMSAQPSDIDHLLDLLAKVRDTK